MQFDNLQGALIALSFFFTILFVTSTAKYHNESTAGGPKYWKLQAVVLVLLVGIGFLVTVFKPMITA